MTFYQLPPTFRKSQASHCVEGKIHSAQKCGTAEGHETNTADAEAYLTERMKTSPVSHLFQ